MLRNKNEDVVPGISVSVATEEPYIRVRTYLRTYEFCVWIKNLMDLASSSDHEETERGSVPPDHSLSSK